MCRRVKPLRHAAPEFCEFPLACRPRWKVHAVTVLIWHVPAMYRWSWAGGEGCTPVRCILVPEVLNIRSGDSVCKSLTVTMLH